VRDQDGNWNEQTEWHRVVCFGSTAENVARFLKKGRQVYIEGRLRTNKWQDRDGNNRYTTEVIARTVQFLGRREEGQGGYTPRDGGNSYSPPANQGYTEPNAAPSNQGMDEDIPF
jgi:single-strand DNA-binding protein